MFGGEEEKGGSDNGLLIGKIRGKMGHNGQDRG